MNNGNYNSREVDLPQDFMTREEFYERLQFAESRGVSPITARQDLISEGYEIEGINAEFTPFEALKNLSPIQKVDGQLDISPSLAEYGKQIYLALKDPIGSVGTMLDVAEGGTLRAIKKITGAEPPTEQQKKSMQLWDTVVNAVAEEYGSVDKALNTAEKDPYNFLSTISPFTEAGGVALKGLTKGTKLARVGTFAHQLGRAIEPIEGARMASAKMAKQLGLGNFAMRSYKELFNLRGEKLKIFSKDLGVFPKDPTEWLVKHNLAPTKGFENMAKRLDRVQKLTVGRVDELLESVPTKFQNKDTRALINNLRDFYAREGKDVVEGVDLVKVKQKSEILDPQGKPVEKIIEKELPYKQEEKVFVARENLSQEELLQLQEIKRLAQRYDEGGLTLFEMNQVKRLSDDVFDIYKKDATAKGGAQARTIDKKRKSTRRFIEDEANKASEAGYSKDLADIRELNRQTRYANAWKELAQERQLIGVERTGVAQSILEVGAYSSSLFGQFKKAGGFLAAVTGLKSWNIPEVRSFVLNRVALMTGGEWRQLLGDINQFSKTGKTGKAMRTLRREAFRYARPVGYVKEKSKLPMKDVGVQLQPTIGSR